MAEKELETVENPQEVEASQPEKEEKMVSVAEMQRRLKQMEEKHTLEIADMQTGIQSQIEEAVAKVKKNFKSCNRNSGIKNSKKPRAQLQRLKLKLLNVKCRISPSKSSKLKACPSTSQRLHSLLKATKKLPS